MNQEMADIDAYVCGAAWLALIVLLPFVLWRVARGARRDLLIALLLGVAAFIPRLLLPWGPLNFVEPERLFPLWTQGERALNDFLAIPLALQKLQKLGFSLETLLHHVEPVVGAVSVALTYGCARAFTLGRRPAALAAILVACSPAHLHFSESLSFSVDAGALMVATLAAAAAASLGWLAIPLITALVTVSVHVRPEMRFLVIPLGMLVFWPGSHWTTSKRIVLVLALGLSLATYLPLVIKPQAMIMLALEMRPRLRELVGWLAHTFLLNGVPWIILAAMGFFRKSLPHRVRWALLAAILVPGGVYWCLASDPSYFWTQWRYYVALVPLLSIAAAAGIARLWPRYETWAVAICVAGAFGVLALEWPVLRLLNDQQAEFQFVRETAAGVMPQTREIYMTRFQDCRVCEGTAALALSTVYGPIDLSENADNTSGIKLRLLSEKTVGSAQTGIVYIGSRRRSEVVTFLERRFELTPVVQRTVDALADHRQCEIHSEADAGRKCPLQMGWYRFQVRTSDRPVAGSGD